MSRRLAAASHRPSASSRLSVSFRQDRRRVVLPLVEPLLKQAVSASEPVDLALQPGKVSLKVFVFLVGLTDDVFGLLRYHWSGDGQGTYEQSNTVWDSEVVAA